MTTRSIRPPSSSSGLKRPSSVRTFTSFTRETPKRPSSAASRSPPKPYGSPALCNGSPNKTNLNEPSPLRRLLSLVETTELRRPTKLSFARGPNPVCLQRRVQDTFYVGTLKGVGRVYQQTVIDTYAKVVFAKLYDRKTLITPAEILNDRVVPFYDEHGIRLSRMLTDRGTEFCGTQSHEYELYLAVEDIDHSRTKTKRPQTNGICERFHRTVLDELYRVAFRKKIYRAIDELQADLDAWIAEYNGHRPHQGRWCFGKTPMQTFLDALPLAKKKLMAA